MYKINWTEKKSVNVDDVNKLLNDSYATGRFSNGGPNVKKLENILRDKLEIDDNKSIIAVTNGSVALHCLASAIAHYHKSPIQWATQSFTFPPSVQGTLSNAKIIDIDSDGGINIEQITDDIDGIIVTNIFGNVVDIDKYVEWANKHNKFLIFDNAATSFTFYKGKNCNNYGNGCTISFHHTKPLGFGEGGAIIVDKKYEHHIRCLCNFGIDLTDEYYVREGNNYKMSDISATYIIQFLNNFDDIVRKHNSLFNYFKNKVEEFKLPIKLLPSFHDNNNKHIPSCICILSSNSKHIEQVILNNNIFCRKYYTPLKKTENAMKLYDNILCIPCNRDMNFSDIDHIVNIIKKDLSNNHCRYLGK